MISNFFANSLENSWILSFKTPDDFVIGDVGKTILRCFAGDDCGDDTFPLSDWLSLVDIVKKDWFRNKRIAKGCSFEWKFVGVVRLRRCFFSHN